MKDSGRGKCEHGCTDSEPADLCHGDQQGWEQRPPSAERTLCQKVKGKSGITSDISKKADIARKDRSSGSNSDKKTRQILQYLF